MTRRSSMPPAARKRIVSTAVFMGSGLVVAALAGVVYLLIGTGPQSWDTGVGMLLSVILALAGVGLALVLITYAAVRMVVGRRADAAAATLVAEFNARGTGQADSASPR